MKKTSSKLVLIYSTSLHALRERRRWCFCPRNFIEIFKTSGEARESDRAKSVDKSTFFVFKELRGFNKPCRKIPCNAYNGLKLLSVVDEHLHRIGEIDSEVSDEDLRRWLMYAGIRSILGAATDLSKSGSCGHISAEERWNMIKSLPQREGDMAFVEDW